MRERERERERLKERLKETDRKRKSGLVERETVRERVRGGRKMLGRDGGMGRGDTQNDSLTFILDFISSHNV